MLKELCKWNTLPQLWGPNTGAGYVEAANSIDLRYIQDMF